MLVPFLVEGKKMCFPDLQFTRADDKKCFKFDGFDFLFMVIIET